MDEALERRNLLLTASKHWAVFTIDGEMADTARRAFPREPIRTLDAIHIAAALVIRSLVSGVQFLTLDERIRSNAAEFGFDVVPADGAGVS